MFEYLRVLRTNTLQDLEFNAGKDALHDRYQSGLLAGINEVLNMSINELIEESDNDS